MWPELGLSRQENLWFVADSDEVISEKPDISIELQIIEEE